MTAFPTPQNVQTVAALAAAVSDILVAGRCYVFIDSEVSRLHPNLNELCEQAPLFIVPSGERHKTLDTAQQMWAFLLENGADRSSMVLAIGGGVTTDMSAFVASTYMRGIRFVLCPTTLLSQVDASMGGKTGIDFGGGKNLVGTFAEPEQVLIAADMLRTLPQRELYSGYAEVLKHGLIYDKAYWDAHKKQQPDQIEVGEMVAHSIGIKYDVVRQDPTEKGLRKILNFGHTIGHAIESYYLTTATPMLHGEAIALGMMLEAALSVTHSGLAQAEANEIRDHLTALGYPTGIDQATIPAILSYMLMDKKNQSGSIRMSLLKAIGHCIPNVEVAAEDILPVLEKSIEP